ALLAGDLTGASNDFAQANSSFVRAGSEMRNPLLRAAGSVPLLGHTTKVLRALADAGQIVSDSGSGLVQELQALPQGLGSLGPTIPSTTSSEPRAPRSSEEPEGSWGRTPS